jgi:hypothetical protein
MSVRRRSPGWRKCWQGLVAKNAAGPSHFSNNCRDARHHRRGGVSGGRMSGSKSETSREIQGREGVSASVNLEVGEDHSSAETPVMGVERRVLTLWMRTSEGKER